MKKYIKYALVAVGGLFALFALLAAVIAFTFNPNDYKPLVVKLVQEKKNRTLTIDGDIKLTLFPKIGADLGRIAISERNRPESEFAAIGSAKVALAVLPLLRKELVVDQVRIDGLRAHLVRNKDGSTNFDDLLEKDKEESPAIKFDVDGVKITNAQVTFDDQQAGRRVDLAELRFSSGRLANAVPGKLNASFQLKVDQPKVAARVQVASGLLFDLDAKRYALDDMDAAVAGQVNGFSTLDFKARGSLNAAPGSGEFGAEGLAVTLAGKHGTDDVEARLEVPKLVLTKTQATGEKVVLDAHLRNPGGGDLAAVLEIPAFEGTGQAFRAGEATLSVNGRQAGGTINAKLAAKLSGSVEGRRLELSGLDGSVVMGNTRLPKGGLTASLTGNATLDMLAEKVRLDLGSRIDESNVKAKLAMDGFGEPRYGFDVNVDEIDLDRYLPKTESKGPEKPFDFSALQRLDAVGKLTVGKLTVANVKTTNFKLEMKADAGKVEAPVSASLYQGTLAGSLRLDAANSHVTIRQQLTNVAIGPLLKDAIARDVLEGRGNVNLDLTARGNSSAAMKKSLQGRAGMELRDGAVKGINIAASIRDAKASLGALKGKKTQNANDSQKTDFSDLKATFVVDRGVARNQDLALKSPLLRLAGTGEVDVGEGSLNYLTKATLVGTLEGQGGKEAAALKGLTVPVRVSGPYAALNYTLDFDALAGDVVRQKVESKTEQVKTQLQDKLKQTFKGFFK